MFCLVPEWIIDLHVQAIQQKERQALDKSVKESVKEGSDKEQAQETGEGDSENGVSNQRPI